ncbi:MAG TPA: thioredoxin family protein [Anaerolineales bacterium]|nr:thioredoxin family protein [Anaerolineales bacterium]
MKIEVLGTGCYKCIKLEALIHDVLEELGKSGIEIVRISDERMIRRYMPLDEIPGLLFNGVLTSSNELPKREKLIEWLSGIPVAGKING